MKCCWGLCLILLVACLLLAVLRCQVSEHPEDPSSFSAEGFQAFPWISAGMDQPLCASRLGTYLFINSLSAIANCLSSPFYSFDR